MPHQLPPEGDWRTWVIMGGRGAGKTRAGAEWVRSVVEGSGPLDEGQCKNIALIGETIDQVREVMIFGDSGIIACSPPDRAPRWEASRKRLVWPNGAVAMAFSAHSPEALRGPQFDGAWVDEIAKWKKAQETWDQLQFGLRLGEHPRACVTTTPRDVKVLRDLLDRDSTVTSHAATEANAANLAASFLSEVRARYGGTRLARQELDGVLVRDAEGALWKTDLLEKHRRRKAPELDQIIVSVDPSVTSNTKSDACGIIVVGVQHGAEPGSDHAYVLEDCTAHGMTPHEWSKVAVDAFHGWGADYMVVETNQGGDLVPTVMKQVDPAIVVTKVHARKGKALRADPVSILYEQGRVHHVGLHEALEDEMVRMTSRGFDGPGSPDRVDALVHGVTKLLLREADTLKPGIRSI